MTQPSPTRRSSGPTGERRGSELARAQSPGVRDLPADEMRRGAGETRVISRFLRNLAVEIEGSSRVISISYTTTDPQLSQQIANAVAQGYIEDQVRLKNDVVADANAFLGSRMEKLRTDVEAAERRVEEFRETTSIVSEEDETLLAEQIYSLNSAQLDAQLELDTANERLDRLEAAMSARGSTRTEHTSELQSLMRISYAVFCLKKKTTTNT